MNQPSGFEEAFRILESAMGDLGTAVSRSQQIEFPDVVVDTGRNDDGSEPSPDPGRTDDHLADLRRWATDENARNAEFARRVDEAIDAEFDDLRGGWLPDGRREEIIEDVRAHMLAQLRRFGGGTS
ncbi:hypothetical protein QSJ19_08530 [Gordonia sp. ABSL11-1]|uniref:hypothetical protein n=1 Tax=Gordonia sp. ABSL11-1 TaxID=3053924 RepID=UPI002573865F|nr:hypothetical protein [Gordonia sp. ABSL11-1]MDL9945632.1 hypothetical protein [Gordonia sp. ABSL11-1]